MTIIRRIARSALVAGCLSAPAVAARAATIADGFSYRPAVPVSAFARPAGWLDPARLSMSTTLSFGSWGGGRTAGLQVTTLRYQLASPLSLQVSLGSALGPGANSRDGLFLEGLDLSWRPSAGTWFLLRYQDLRSPLQRQPFWGY